MRQKQCYGAIYRAQAGREAPMAYRERSGAIRRCPCPECSYLRRLDAPDFVEEGK